MNPQYVIHDTSVIYSPALLFYKDLIRRNIARAVELAGSPERLRPHAKTHKTREIVRLQMEAGIVKHKVATVAEAEMVASCGAPDVLLDLDVGQHRTGIAPDVSAAVLYKQIERTAGLRPGGLHVYDGHNHQDSPAEREAAVRSQLTPVLELRQRLEQHGLPVPRLVLGGTPTFPMHARVQEPGVECSPGTFVLHDNGYGSRFADLAGFTPAALLLTRVISRPTERRITLDLGYKAVASDPPAGKRCVLLNVPEYEAVLQNEEHFVVETPHAGRFEPGDQVFAMPTHVCPTCAMHKLAYVVDGRRVVGTWDIVARDRVLAI